MTVPRGASPHREASRADSIPVYLQQPDDTTEEETPEETLYRRVHRATMLLRSLSDEDRELLLRLRCPQGS